MLINSVYRTLFKVTIYHGYFLNDGENVFLDLDGKERTEQLRDYDWRSFLRLQPSAATQQKLSGQKLFLKEYPTGFSIAIKVNEEDDKAPFVSLSPELDLTFLMYFGDPHFMNYTDFVRPENAMLYLSNKAPSLPEPYDFEPIPLSQPSGKVSDAYWLSGTNRNHLLNEIMGDDKRPLDGVLRIYMQGDTGQYNLISNQGKLKNTPLHFTLHFNNKSTIWKYINKAEGFETETKKAWPLTKNGFIQLDPQTDLKSPPAGADNYSFPNPVPGITISKANKIYSEIFI